MRSRRLPRGASWLALAASVAACDGAIIDGGETGPPGGQRTFDSDAGQVQPNSFFGTWKLTGLAKDQRQNLPDITASDAKLERWLVLDEAGNYKYFNGAACPRGTYIFRAQALAFIPAIGTPRGDENHPIFFHEDKTLRLSLSLTKDHTWAVFGRTLEREKVPASCAEPK